MAEKNYRTGDKISIAGNYQHNALHNGPVIQRWWHKLKLQTAVQLANIPASGKVLDIGCGSGVLTELLLPGIRYTGVDSNQEALNFATGHYRHPNSRFLHMQIDDLHQLGSNCFDSVFFLETIEHIHPEQAAETLGAIKDLLITGGCCMITTPNRKSAWPLIERIMDLFKVVPTLGGKQHEHLFSKKELVEMVHRYGLTTDVVKTSNGLAPWLSWLGSAATNSIHDWEMRNDWFPGSLIVLRIRK